MRKYNFEEYRKEIKEKYYENFDKLEPERHTSRRPRKEEDMSLLLEMAKLRKKRWLETGKLKITGERKYKLGI